MLTKQFSDDNDETDDCKDVNATQADFYSLNIFKVNVDTSKNKDVWSLKTSEFQVELVINGAIAKVTADTGAKVSVCGKVQAIKCKLFEKLCPTSVKIKPYNSPPVAAMGMARCSVTFGNTSILVCWYILEGSCEPILSGKAQLHWV